VRPLIGIPAYTGTNPLADQLMPTAFLPDVYARAVRRSGGRPVLLPPGGDDVEAEHTVRWSLDGLLLPGGPDISAALYGQESHSLAGEPDIRRDEWEMALTIHALVNGVPILGICRGMQMLNVRLGGTLHQHLMHAEPHGSQGQPGYGVHQVDVRNGSVLAKIIGNGPVAVPTRHHQGVAKLGRGLDVSARHADGTIEAVEMTGQRFVVGVQWHPERDTDTRLFDAFVEAADRA